MAGSRGSRGPGSVDYTWKGLQVIDNGGCEVGRVEFVKLGESSASGPRGSRARTDIDLASWLAEATEDNHHPDLETRIAERMLRLGFVKVDSSGTTGCDLYVPADQIASVLDGTVRLTVSLDELTPKSADLARTTA